MYWHQIRAFALLLHSKRIIGDSVRIIVQNINRTAVLLLVVSHRTYISGLISQRQPSKQRIHCNKADAFVCTSMEIDKRRRPKQRDVDVCMIFTASVFLYEIWVLFSSKSTLINGNSFFMFYSSFSFIVLHRFLCKPSFRWTICERKKNLIVFAEHCNPSECNGMHYVFYDKVY